MSDKLTNAYALHAELTDVQQAVSEERQALTANKYAQQFFTVSTWIVYLLFAAAMYAAPLWVLQSFFGANAGNYLAIVIIGVFLVVMPTALALGKHAGYRALSKRGIDPRYMGAIIAFFILSGIYFEMTSATSQQQEKAHQAVENSNAGKSIMNTTVSTNTGATAGLIADAEFKLVACQRLLAAGKVKDCNNSQARVDSLKSQASADRQAAIVANTEAITAKQAALDKERDSHALPIAKSFSEIFHSTVATGAVIAALIAALIFEISHSLTIYNEWRIKKEMAGLDGAFKQLKIDYFHTTGKQFSDTDFKEGEIIDLVEMRENGNITHFKDKLQDAVSPAPSNDGAFQKTSIGFTAPLRTAASGGFAGFVDTNGRASKPDNRPFYGFNDPKKQAALDALNLANGSEDRKTWDNRTANALRKTYREAIREGSQQWQDTALDAPHPSSDTQGDTHQNALHERVLHERVDTHQDSDTQGKTGVTRGICPQCGTHFKPVNKWHTFCCSTCKDAYHNERNPERKQHLKRKRGS